MKAGYGKGAKARAIRSLSLGEQPPEGEPRRYRNADGYIRLRWVLADGGFVECYEHRWAMGVVGRDDVQVHHVNHQRDDNRPENLRVVTPQEHAEEHRYMDTDELEAMRATREGGEQIRSVTQFRAYRLEQRRAAHAATFAKLVADYEITTASELVDVLEGRKGRQWLTRREQVST